MRISRGASLMLAGALAGFACGGDEEGNGNGGQDQLKPVIEQLTVDPTTARPGDTVTLRWTVKEATDLALTANGSSVDVASNATQATYTVADDETADSIAFELLAKNANGEAKRTVTLTVETRNVVPPTVRIDRFTVTPLDANPGDTVTLSWAVTGADDEDISILSNPAVAITRDQPGSATAVVTETTTFTLRVTKGEAMVDASRTVTVIPQMIELEAEITNFVVLPHNRPQRGSEVTLQWRTENATRIVLTDGGAEIHEATDADAAEGSFQFTAGEPVHVLELVAYNAEGTATAPRTLVIETQTEPLVAEIINFSVSPSVVTSFPATVELTWEATGILNLVQNDVRVLDFSGASSGTRSFTINEPTVFRLLAADGDGNLITEEAAVTTDGVFAMINRFEADVTEISGPTVVTLSWDAVGDLSLTQDGEDVPGFSGDATGTLVVNVSEPTVFELVAEGDNNTARAQVEIVRASDGNDTADTATPFSIPGAISGTLDAELLFDRQGNVVGGDYDFYRLSLTAANHFRFTLQNCDAATAITALTLARAGQGGALEVIAQTNNGEDDTACPTLDSYQGVPDLLDPAGTYFVIVAGLGRGGPWVTGPSYTLDAQIATPACGDGNVDGALEQCDDGNTTDGDFCDSSCNLYSVASQETFTGTLQGSDFSVVLVEAKTQDSITVSVGDQGCTGPFQVAVAHPSAPTGENGAPQFTPIASDTPESGCASLTLIEAPPLVPSGNNELTDYFWVYFNAPNGTTNPVTVSITVTNPSCGNGFAEFTAGEQCDDGNANSDDGCSSTCTFEGTLPTSEVEPNEQGQQINPVVGTPTTIYGSLPGNDTDAFIFQVPNVQGITMDTTVQTDLVSPATCDWRDNVLRFYLVDINGGQQQLVGIRFGCDTEWRDLNDASQFAGSDLALIPGGAYAIVVASGVPSWPIGQYVLDINLSTP